MPRFQLKADPYVLELYCPFCGEHVVGSEGEGFTSPCEHAIYLGIGDPDDEDMDDAEEDAIKETDLVFVAFETGPASQEHIFAFREPS